MTLNLYAEYSVPFIKGLKARGSYARNMGDGRVAQIGTSYKLYQFVGTGTNGHIYDENSVVKTSVTLKNGDRLYYDNSNSLSEQYNLTASYARDFGKHSVSGLFSIEKSEAESSNEVEYKEGVLETTNGQFTTAFGTVFGSTAASESGSLAYVGRANMPMMINI